MVVGVGMGMNGGSSIVNQGNERPSMMSGENDPLISFSYFVFGYGR